MRPSRHDGVAIGEPRLGPPRERRNSMMAIDDAMTALELKLPPPLVGALAFLASWLLAQWLPAPALPSWWQYVAGPLALIGGGICTAAFYGFWRARTTINPLAPARASRLVTTGVYRFSRNPMYLGLAVVLVAWAMHTLALAAFAAPLAFVLFIDRFQVVPEERALTARFGDEYARYRLAVRRWL